LDGSSICYEPDFSEFEAIFLDVYNRIIKSVENVPRVETKLYPDWVNYQKHSIEAYLTKYLMPVQEPRDVSVTVNQGKM